MGLLAQLLPTLSRTSAALSAPSWQDCERVRPQFMVSSHPRAMLGEAVKILSCFRCPRHELATGPGDHYGLKVS